MLIAVDNIGLGGAFIRRGQQHFFHNILNAFNLRDVGVYHLDRQIQHPERQNLRDIL